MGFGASGPTCFNPAPDKHIYVAYPVYDYIHILLMGDSKIFMSRYIMRVSIIIIEIITISVVANSQALKL